MVIFASSSCFVVQVWNVREGECGSTFELFYHYGEDEQANWKKEIWFHSFLTLTNGYFVLTGLILILVSSCGCFKKNDWKNTGQLQCRVWKMKENTHILSDNAFWFECLLLSSSHYICLRLKSWTYFYFSVMENVLYLHCKLSSC